MSTQQASKEFKVAVAVAGLVFSAQMDGRRGDEVLSDAAATLVGALWVFAASAGMSADDFVDTTAQVARVVADGMNFTKVKVQ